MAEYLDLDLAADATTLYDDAVDAIATLAPPEWEPSEVEQWVLEAVARMGVELSVLAGVVPTQIFQYFGESLLSVPVTEAAPATGTVTFTLTDALGHVIAAGTQLDIDGVGFTTDADLTITAPAETGNIGVTAVVDGTEGNDLDGTSIEVISPSYLFIESVALTAPTSGGSDGETGEEYADRLADELTTLSPKAILIEDFEAIARRNTAVGRALAIDNYDADTANAAAEGHVTIVAHDAAGDALTGGVKTEIEADLEENRVLNLTVHVIDPTYHTINVSFTATAYDDYDPATVEAEAEAAVTDYLDATTWGRPTFADTDRWVNETTVYRTDLIGVVRNVAGVRHVTALTLAIDPAALGTSDLTMTGVAPLPVAGTITGTVT